METVTFFIGWTIFMFVSGICVGGLITLESLENFMEKEAEKDKGRDA